MGRIAAFACLLVALCSVVHAELSIPLENFTRSDETGIVKISPDGTHIALTTGDHGGQFLSVFDLTNKKIAGGARAPSGFVVYDFDWASPTRIVFKIGERMAGEAFPRATGEIFSMNRDGSDQKLIYGYRAGQQSTGTHVRVRSSTYASANIVSLLDSDPHNILIAEMPWRLTGNYWRYNRDAKPELKRLDIRDGSQRSLGRVPLAHAEVIVDRADQPRFAVGLNDSQRQAVAWKRTPEAAWEAFELPGYRKESLVPLRFTPDNRNVLFKAVTEGTRYAALFKLDLEQRTVEKVIELPDADVEALVTDFEDQEVIGVSGYTDKLIYSWILPTHPAARLQQAMQRAFQGNEVRFLNHTDDGSRAIVFVQSDVAPGEYLLFDTKSKKAEMIRAARPWIDWRTMQPKESFTFKARDGLPIHGYLTRPKGNAPFPLIVMPHGGPHGVRDVWAFDPEVQLLASRGYAVLQVNYRGSGGYGMDFELAGLREWGGKMQDDVTDATQWAIEQKVAQADRICIVGASYGGYSALMGAVREPKLYRCAIGSAGVYDLQLMFESADIPRSKSGVAYLTETLGTDAADLQARSLVFNADKIGIPVLLIHGKEDGRADYAHAKRMKEALEAQHKPVELIALRGEGHGVYDDDTRREVQEGILKFLDTHLSPQR